MKTNRTQKSLEYAGRWNWAGLVLAAVVIAGLGIPAVGQTQILWNEPDGGFFQDELNWDPDTAAPASGELGVFDLNQAAAYTVELLAAHTAGGLQVRTDRVVLDLAGNGMTLDLAGTSPRAFTVAPNADDSGFFTLQNSGALATMILENMSVAAGSGSTGGLTLTGANTRMRVDHTTDSLIASGSNSTATLTVQEGARLNFTRRLVDPRDHNLVVAGTAGSSGTVLVTGAGSQLVVANAALIQLGANNSGQALMTIEDGGYASARNFRFYGQGPTGEYGAKLVVDNGTLNLVLSFEMGWSSSGSDSLEVLNGGLVETAGAGSMIVGRSGSGTVNSSVLVSGSNTNGDPSRFLVGGSIRLGGVNADDDNATATLTVADGGVVTANTFIRLHDRATLAVDGGTVTASEIQLSTQTDPESTIRVTLQNANATDAPIRIVEGALSGNVDLGIGLTTLDLRLDDDFLADLGDTFLLLSYEGDLTGTFKGLGQSGDTLWDIDNTVHFEISYDNFGEGDAIALKVIPEPQSLALILLGLAATALRRTRRKG